MTALARKKPEAFTVVHRSGIRFEGHLGEREVAYQGDYIVGQLIPCGDMRGGWVYIFAGQRSEWAKPRWVENRSEGRDILVANVLAAKTSPSSAHSDSASRRAPANRRVSPHNARYSQGGTVSR